MDEPTCFSVRETKLTNHIHQYKFTIGHAAVHRCRHCQATWHNRQAGRKTSAFAEHQLSTMIDKGELDMIQRTG